MQHKTIQSEIMFVAPDNLVFLCYYVHWTDSHNTGHCSFIKHKETYIYNAVIYDNYCQKTENSFIHMF